MGSRSVLEALEDICNVDVDAIDPKVSTSLPFKAHNQTSNQVICCNTMLDPEYRNVFLELVKKYGDQGWNEVFNRVMVYFCANNLKNITERVLVQVAPRYVYDKDAVLKQCHDLDRAFRESGVTRDQYAIKMAVTGPAMAAAAELNREGIRTLGTSLFGLPQAIAASQAGCLFVSPYFNEVGAILHESDDPALTTYAKMCEKTGKEQPTIIVASNESLGEIVANAELGCQHITILAKHLKALQETPLDATALKKYPIFANPPPKKRAPYYKNLVLSPRFKSHSTSDPLAGPDWDGKLASTEIDYIANNGAALEEANIIDSAVAKKLVDILAIFHEFDEKARVAIEAEIAKLKD